MFFGCTVVSTMTRESSEGFMAPVLVATHCLLKTPPVLSLRMLHEGVLHLDDRADPRPNHTPLPPLPPLPWPHRTLRQSRSRAENHGWRFEGIPNLNLQENRPRSPNFRQIQSLEFLQFLLPVNRFGIFHGRQLTRLLRQQRKGAVPVFRRRTFLIAA